MKYLVSDKRGTRPFTENHKTSLTEIKDLHKWRDLQCSWVRRSDIGKRLILPQLILRFKAIPSRISPGFFVKIDKRLLKFIWKCKGPGITQTA